MAESQITFGWLKQKKIYVLFMPVFVNVRKLLFYSNFHFCIVLFLSDFGHPRFLQ